MDGTSARGRARPPGDGEGGFSLVELLVVTVILGVLVAIAITTFLVQRDKAHRSAALSTLRNTYTVAEARRSADGATGYPATPGDYQAELQGYEFVAGDQPSAASDIVSTAVDAGDPGGAWVAFAVWGGGDCYYLRLESEENRVFRDRKPLSGSDCTGEEFDDTGGPGLGWE